MFFSCRGFAPLTIFSNNLSILLYFFGGVFVCRHLRHVITRRSFVHLMCVALGRGLFSIHVGSYSCFF